MSNSAIEVKSKRFAIRIVNLYKELTTKRSEYVMAKQVLRSGTSIGANIAEAIYAESTPDFIHKRSIALKETSETKYLLEILHETDYLSSVEFKSIIQDCLELLKMLVSQLKTSKEEYEKELSTKNKQ